MAQEVVLTVSDRLVSEANPLPTSGVLTVAAAAAVVHGQKTIGAAGTEEALASSTALAAGVRVKALHANTGWVYVGAYPVTSTTGFVLDAGEEVFIEVDNLADVFIDVSVNGEGVSYIGS